MKSEGTSSGFASASDSICKIFLAAKIFASGSDAFDSEYASFPPFHIKCISAKMSYLFVLITDTILTNGKASSLRNVSKVV